MDLDELIDRLLVIQKQGHGELPVMGRSPDTFLFDIELVTRRAKDNFAETERIELQ